MLLFLPILFNVLCSMEISETSTRCTEENIYDDVSLEEAQFFKDIIFPGIDDALNEVNISASNEYVGIDVKEFGVGLDAEETRGTIQYLRYCTGKEESNIRNIINNILLYIRSSDSDNIVDYFDDDIHNIRKKIEDSIMRLGEKIYASASQSIELEAETKEFMIRTQTALIEISEKLGHGYGLLACHMWGMSDIFEAKYKS